MSNNVIGPDVSFYQDDPTTAASINFVKMAANAGYVIIRAGQNTWEDVKFDISWKASKGLLPRGSYWFYDSRIDPKVQAKKYISCFADPKDMGELPLWCDFEDTYGGPFGTWRHWYDFIEELKRLAPGKAIGIYTAYYYWRERTLPHMITVMQLAYFKQYPLWIANYNVTVPLVPAPWDATEWTLWQITDNGDGALYGVESKNIDLNYFNGDETDFENFFGVSLNIPVPSPADVVTHPFDGVKQVHSERFGRRVYVNIIDLKAVRIEVCNEDSRPSAICIKYGAQIAWNGDDWDRTTRRAKDNPSPSLLVFPDGHISIGNHATTSSEVYHTSGLRFLVQNGANIIPPAGTEAKYTERHARSVIGVNATGGLVHLTVDGDYPDKGATLYECGQIMIEFGAVVAFDQGGGGDSVEVLNGRVVNLPDDNVGEIRYERKVPQTILIFKKERTNMTTYTMETIAPNGTRKRTDHTTFAAYVLPHVPMNQTVEGDELWEAPADGLEVKKGDQWLRITKVNGVPVTQPLWMAYIHKGEPVCSNLKVVGSTPDPEPTPEYQDVDLQLNIYQGALSVRVNGEEWIKKTL